MANICVAEGVVTGTVENIEKFCDLFLSLNQEENEKKEKYFARSTLIYGREEINGEEKRERKTVDFAFECAWSVSVCMFKGKGFYTEKNSKCVLLEDIVRDLDLSIELVSNEMGLMLREYVSGNSSKGLSYEAVPIASIYECSDCAHEEVTEKGEAEEELKKCPHCLSVNFFKVG